MDCLTRLSEMYSKCIAYPSKQNIKSLLIRNWNSFDRELPNPEETGIRCYQNIFSSIQ